MPAVNSLNRRCCQSVRQRQAVTAQLSCTAAVPYISDATVKTLSGSVLCETIFQWQTLQTVPLLLTCDVSHVHQQQQQQQHCSV
eukprot:3393-Heterococcus_DN1.PRE.2